MDLPLIGTFEDDIYPYEGIERIRFTTRAILENQDGLFGFLHIQGEDYFGKRNHLETVGGGIEYNEVPETAMQREIMEETGLQALTVQPIGCIVDSYNPIYRTTCSFFYHVRVNTEDLHTTHRTEEEEILISEILWFSEEEALARLSETHYPVDVIVQRRDKLAFEYYLKQRKN